MGVAMDMVSLRLTGAADCGLRPVGATEHLRSFGNACPVSLWLLENGREDKERQCGRSTGVPVDRYVKPLSEARNGSPERVSDALKTDRNPPVRRGVEISTESLILAQDERWRRA